jgi:hypothetical protein
MLSQYELHQVRSRAGKIRGERLLAERNAAIRNGMPDIFSQMGKVGGRPRNLNIDELRALRPGFKGGRANKSTYSFMEESCD